jgi:acyl carrier protein
MNPTTQRLIDLLADKYGLARELLGPDVTFDDLDLDSLVLVEILVTLERERGVPLAEGLIEADQTIGAAAAALDAVLARAA